MSRRPLSRRVPRLHSAFHEEREEEDFSRLMIHVICFGNLWQGDDGFGVRVFQRLCDRSDWPAHVKMFEAGTAGLAALDFFLGWSKVGVVEALKTWGAAGGASRVAVGEVGVAG